MKRFTRVIFTLQIHQHRRFDQNGDTQREILRQGGPDEGTGPEAQQGIRHGQRLQGRRRPGRRRRPGHHLDALGRLAARQVRGHPLPRLLDPRAPRQAAQGPRRHRAPARGHLLSSPPRRDPDLRGLRRADRRVAEAQRPAPVPHRRHERRPQGHAPHDPVLAGHPPAPEGFGVRPPLQREDAEEPVLGCHVRGRHEPHRQAPEHRGLHLPPHLLRRQAHRPRPEARLGRQPGPHARRQQGPRLQGAHAALPVHPQRPRGRQRVGPHDPPRRLGPVRSVLLPVGRHERPGRPAARPGQPGSPGLDHGPA